MIQHYIQNPMIRFIDHSKATKIFNEPNRAFISFAIDDAIATEVGAKSSLPTVRCWVHEPTLVLGIPDSRLPHIKEGVQFIKAHHHQVLIRNSGGLAVLLDHGVLNMSFIIPNNGSLSINDGYDMMFQCIKTLFSPYTSIIKAYEITGSYCPGDYDLSIDGIKFAGISQRRVRNGVAVQIYIDVEGSSFQRASLVKDFYRISKQEEPTSYTYPEINPNVMGTISELTGHPFTVDEVIQDMKALLVQEFTVFSDTLSDKEEALFYRRLEQMNKRNEKLQEE